MARKLSCVPEDIFFLIDTEGILRTDLWSHVSELERSAGNRRKPWQVSLGRLQSEWYHVSWWYYTLVIDLIGQLRRDVIGRLSVDDQ